MVVGGARIVILPGGTVEELNVHTKSWHKVVSQWLMWRRNSEPYLALVIYACMEMVLILVGRGSGR